MRHILLAALLAAGCSSRTPVPVEAQPAAAERVEALPQTRPASDSPTMGEAPEAPAGVAELKSIMMAWHVDDLPDRQGLDAHDDAQRSLVWMARYGSPNVVRVRALRLLGEYRDAETGQMLSGVAGDSTQHATVRAGAVAGLAGQDLAGDAALRGAVESALQDDDLRVQLAAVESLTGIEASTPALTALAADASTGAQLKAAVDAALRP